VRFASALLPQEEEALVDAKASLNFPMARPRLPSAQLIEAARRPRDGRKEYSVPGIKPGRLPKGRRETTKGWIGVSPHAKRTARTTSQDMTATTILHSPFLNNVNQEALKKPLLALAWSVRKKLRREALDPQRSFRDGNSQER
jgi:hypothetical protein